MSHRSRCGSGCASPGWGTHLTPPPADGLDERPELPGRAAYDELLTRHGVSDLGTTSLPPMHALTWGRRR